MSRRYISICREGWYYLFVLLFIVGGAVMRQVNLLVVLAGLMIGPFLLNWRFVSATVRRIAAKRSMPDRICAGDSLTVDLTVTNSRRRLGSWALVVEDTIELEDAPNDDYQTNVEVLFPHVAAGDSSRAAYRCCLNRRGRYRFGPLKISTRFPLGLVRAAVIARQFDTLIVGPRVGRLTRQWAQAVESRQAGQQLSQRRRGLVEGDFYGMRDWRAGDSHRLIHWRTSAKLSNLAVKQFEQQRNLDIAVVLDLWQPRQADARQLELVETSVSFAATVAIDVCRRGGSRFTLGVAGQPPQFRQAAASQLLLVDTLEQLAVVAGAEANSLADVLQRAMHETAAGTHVIVVSTRDQQMTNSIVLDATLTRAGGREPIKPVRWIDVGSDDFARYFQWE